MNKHAFGISFAPRVRSIVCFELTCIVLKLQLGKGVKTYFMMNYYYIGFGLDWFIQEHKPSLVVVIF